MATVSLSAHRWDVLSPVVAAYRRWRFAKARTLCKKCAECGVALDVEAATLLKSGHFSAAVFVARLQLERELADLANGIDIANRSFFGRHWVPLLLANQRLTKPQANRVQLIYARASRIVHGRPCSYGRANGIVQDVSRVLGQIRTKGGAA